MPEATVVIWRSHLLPGSETFIRNQGDALSRWRPRYLGAVKVESSIARDTDVIAFPDDARGRAELLGLKLTGRSRRLEAPLARLRPEVVHAHFGGDGWLVSRAAGRLGVPLVITLHGQDVTWRPNLPGLSGVRQRRLLRQAFDRAALIIAVSEFIRGRAVALGADPRKVRVHHTGVPIPPSVPAPDKKWDVVFVGRFVEKKGIDDLVEAVGMLPAALRPRMLFIGTGPLEAATRERAGQLGLDATFLGMQDPGAVSRHLAESKVLVAPSRIASDGDCEGLPTTILEAASVGVPTIATYHSGIPEAVLPGETGLLGAERDRAALADNIRQLLGDDALRARLGARARQHVAEHFDLHQQTRRLEELYDSLAARSLSS
ncbi:glycosyltransferase [Micromonospora inositola]|uniref:Glycosyltransferase involved in cell wall bisynthesis n=1 Tax=Micromonospora inositola TaxID=47865 RepID=A0A1C5JW03_9ACTN|nr:glycosyltransferase [Micromonospora inositola]SCG74687.1 Glycosyltransferase involved in cell wall bisynthesis [Micromonospora inositola]